MYIPPMRFFSLKFKGLCATGLGIVCAVSLNAGGLDGLVKNSPFGEGKSGSGGERTGALEFRGYYVDNGVTYFSIYNPTSKSSVWVAEGETSVAPFAVSVKNFDLEKNSVNIETAGQVSHLDLHQSTIGKMEIPVIAPTNNSAGSNSPVAVSGSNNGGNGGQASPEQAQAFKDQMKQRWQDRQNQNNTTANSGENSKNRGNRNSESSTETPAAKNNKTNKAK